MTKKLKNTNNFIKSYLDGKTGTFVLSRSYGRGNQQPKVMAHAFKEALNNE